MQVLEYYNKLRNARAFIVLLAALITLILNIKYKRELLNSLIIILIVIIIFYIIATIALKLVDKIVHMENSTEDISNVENNKEETDSSQKDDNIES